MATLVCFHAHPDDECIQTGGVMRKAADEGHRVVLVVATKGEHGEVADGFLDPDETLEKRRVAETHAAADILGAERVEFLGYLDSGMIGTPTNELPGSFWQADVEEAAEKLAVILRDVEADVLTVYDDHGGYGHPDHIQVHRVGLRAAELAGTRRVFQVTVNRDEVREFVERLREGGVDLSEFDDGAPDVLEDPDFGKPAVELTARVDVTPWADAKRRAMQAHASQIGDQSFFLRMPANMFALAFGTEWFIRAGEGPGISETDLLEGLR
ncbi:MAG: PIG-L family deacetylase [Acidimicrobiia bacterium]